MTSNQELQAQQPHEEIQNQSVETQKPQSSTSKEQLELQKITEEIENLRIETQKLQGGTPKEKLEIQKLHKEIRNLPGYKSALANIIAAWLGVASIGGSLIYGVWHFFDEQKFRVTNEMISVVKQLHSEKQVEREDAAILLSNYGEHAIPILIPGSITKCNT